MKKVLVLVGAICLGLLALSPCWSGGQQARPALKEPEVVTLSFYRYSNVAHNRYMVPLLEAFAAEYPNIKISSVEVSSGGFEAMTTKVLLGLAAGTPPDVTEVGYNFIKTHVESGAAIVLDPLMKGDAKFKKGNLIPAMLDLGKVEGKQYLLPLGTSTPMMFLNKDLFLKVGLDPAKPPKTWKQAEEAAQILKNAGHEGIIWSWTTTGNWIFQTMIENAGGQIADENATQILLNRESGIATMEYLSGLVKKGLMAVTDQVVGSFVLGNLGMVVLSSFNRVDIPRQAKFDVLMAPIPTPTGGTPKLPAGGKGFMMFAKDARQQSASWDFMRFITEEKAGRIVAENSGYTPANQAVVDALQKEHADDPNFVITLKQAGNVRPWYSWPGENGGKATKILRDAQEAILLGKVTPKEGLNKAAAEIVPLMKR